MKYVIPAAIAIGVGLITLLSYLVQNSQLLAIRLILTDWAVILGGLAVLVGLLNLLLVHARRVQAQSRGWFYSLITAGAALLTLVLGIVEGLGQDTPALYQQTSITRLLFSGVLVTSQAALAVLVMFFLIVGAVRMLRTRADLWSVGFLAAVVITLIGWLPLQFAAPLNGFREWLIHVPASAGARGILIGVALGTIAIGIRVLTGAERPYKD